MRLGSYDCKVKPNTLLSTIYQEDLIKERHRHRFEFNNEFLEKFNEKGIVFSGLNTQNNLVETIEIPSHRWFIGVQYHPEYKSTVINPHPLFVNFVAAAIDFCEEKNNVNSEPQLN